MAQPHYLERVNEINMPTKKKTTKKKSNAGRPTKYSKAMVKKVYEYLEQCKDVEIRSFKQSKVSELGAALASDLGEDVRGEEVYESKLVVNIPSIEGFSLFIDVHKDTIYEWQKKYKEFSDAIDKITSEQKVRLLSNGLSGAYNSRITNLMLSANHGMAEKKELDHKSDGKQISVISSLIDSMES